MVRLLFAAYIESRPPGIAPLRPAVPVVQVHNHRAQGVTQRLARSFDLGPAFENSSRGPMFTSGHTTDSTVGYTGPGTNTEPGWRGFAYAFFSETA